MRNGVVPTFDFEGFVSYMLCLSSGGFYVISDREEKVVGLS